MKYLYTTPEFKVEELIKIDVLCASSESNEPVKNGAYNIEDSAGSWKLEDFI